jgi:hypothetical protein
VIAIYLQDASCAWRKTGCLLGFILNPTFSWNKVIGVDYIVATFGRKGIALWAGFHSMRSGNLA